MCTGSSQLEVYDTGMAVESLLNVLSTHSNVLMMGQTNLVSMGGDCGFLNRTTDCKDGDIAGLLKLKSH